MREARCDNCKFYHEGNGFVKPTCRRYPPQGNDVNSSFPNTSFVDWCGEHKPVPAKIAEP